MARPSVGEGLGWAAVAGMAACCGITALVAAGVAGAVLWSAGLGLLGLGVFAGGWLYVLRSRRRRACDPPAGIEAGAGSDSRGGQP